MTITDATEDEEDAAAELQAEATHLLLVAEGALPDEMTRHRAEEADMAQEHPTVVAEELVGHERQIVAVDQDLTHPDLHVVHLLEVVVEEIREDQDPSLQLDATVNHPEAMPTEREPSEKKSTRMVHTKHRRTDMKLPTCSRKEQTTLKRLTRVETRLTRMTLTEIESL